ncbi:MAG: hypothetical protein F083_2387 [bacterium F083]|nr:MAG: hypothetical protein F083_2387 [bacterium F083]
MILNNKKRDYNLLLLVIIEILNIFIMFSFGLDNKIRYALLFLNFIPIIMCKKDKMIPTLFFVQTNAGLYDDLGFLWLFNISILIIALRKVFVYREKIEKKLAFLFSLIAFYELVMLLFNYTNLLQFFSFISWVSSYILLITSIESEKDSFTLIYKYFSIGFIFSFLCGLAYPISIWGFNWPTAFRYVGMLRDANYYSMNALLIIFGAGTYEKLTKKNSIIFIVLFSVLGFVSISKMFILVLLAGLIIRFLVVRDKKISFSKTIVFFLVILVSIIAVYKTGLGNLIYEKYIYRSERTSFLTGRDDIQKYYIKKMYDEPSVLLLGRSTNYSQVLGLGEDGNNVAFKNFVSHNTILDCFLSWGIIGTIVYLLFIINIFQKYKIHSSKKNENEFVCIIIVFFAMLFALSLLMNDAFAIFLLYLNILRNIPFNDELKKGDENEKI